MTAIWSCPLIVDRKLSHDSRHVRDFTDADFFVGELFLPYFLNRLYPQTLAYFLAIMPILGKL